MFDLTRKRRHGRTLLALAIAAAAAYTWSTPALARPASPPTAIMVDASPTYAYELPAPQALAYRAAPQDAPVTPPLTDEDQAGLAKLLDLLEDLSRLAPLAALIVPLTELRRIFGGLGSIPLPGGQSISPGRWVSWLCALGLLLLGWRLGYVNGPSPEIPFGLWLGSRWAILGILANVIYDRWFAPPVAPAPVVVEGRVAARA